MTKEQIISVFNKNGCVAEPLCVITSMEWHLSETDSSLKEKTIVMMPYIKKVIFGEYMGDNNVFTYDELTPELIEERINAMRKQVKISKINERLNDLMKDFK
jgi:hypothetical protein